MVHLAADCLRRCCRRWDPMETHRPEMLRRYSPMNLIEQESALKPLVDIPEEILDILTGGGRHRCEGRFTSKDSSKNPCPLYTTKRKHQPPGSHNQIQPSRSLVQ